MMLRRHLLAMLPLAPALVPLAAEAACQPAAGLASLVSGPAAQRLGRAYLRVATEQCPTAIDTALHARLAVSGHDGSPEALRRAVGEAIANDFATSRTALVDGWLLAETECRLCALTALAA
jgi:hypothetical protein